MKLINKENSIFIAGHKGLVGRAICKKLIEKGYKNLITVDKSQVNLCNRIKVKDFLEFKKILERN